MPKGWWIRIGAGRWQLANALVYSQPPEAAVYDSNTKRGKRRLIFFIAIPKNASDKQVLAPIGDLALSWAVYQNYIGGFTLEPLGAPQSDSSGNEHREAVITFRGQRSRLTLMRYKQIKAQGRVFWCVIGGNTQLDIADKALLDAVAKSFRLLENI